MEDVTATLKVVLLASGLAVALILSMALVCYLVHLVLSWRRNRHEVEFVKQHDVSSDW